MLLSTLIAYVKAAGGRYEIEVDFDRRPRTRPRLRAVRTVEVEQANHERGRPAKPLNRQATNRTNRPDDTTSEGASIGPHFRSKLKPPQSNVLDCP